MAIRGGDEGRAKKLISATVKAASHQATPILFVPRLQATKHKISTMEMISSLEKPNQLKSIPGGGLKVAFPVWKNWQGVAASFRRSGTRKESVVSALGDVSTYREKAGEFCVLATVANFASPEEGMSASGGWKGTKVKGHVGLN